MLIDNRTLLSPNIVTEIELLAICLLLNNLDAICMAVILLCMRTIEL